MLTMQIVIIFPHWVCQIGTNLYGSGLHAWNVPDEWIVPYWQVSLVCPSAKQSL